MHIPLWLNTREGIQLYKDQQVTKVVSTASGAAIKTPAEMEALREAHVAEFGLYPQNVTHVQATDEADAETPAEKAEE